MGIVFIGLVWSAVARAEPVSLCNETSHYLQASVAYADGAASRSEGWLTIEPGSCSSALEARPSNATAYVYAVSHPVHAGRGLLFDGRERFCIGRLQEDFEIDGRRECRVRGYLGVDFAPIDLGGKKQRVIFTEPEDYTKSRAVTAAIQRLLSDMGYEIAAIDGFVGRQTDTALELYTKEYKVPASLASRADKTGLMAHLFETVQKIAPTRGLRFCNKTSYLVWAATGAVTPRGVISKGWVKVPAGSCQAALNEPLNERYYFTYAEAVGPDGALVLEAGRARIWSGDFPMCVKTTRFVIDGNEDCFQRGFEEARFSRIDTGDAKSWTVTLE